MAQASDLQGFPTDAPRASIDPIQFADVAVTATAKEFAGIYRNKQQHEPDFDAVLERALSAGVKNVMLTGMSLHDVEFNVRIAQARPQQCSITVGVHPYHAQELVTEGGAYVQDMPEIVSKLLQEGSVRLSAIGELGLDYDHLEKASQEVQMHAFKTQLDLVVANQWNLPLFLHCRAAFDDFVEVMETYLPRLPCRSLVHSFVGSKAQMQTLVEMGFDISVNGFSFKDRESLEMVAAIPLDRLQIETDAPWGEVSISSALAQRYLVHAPALPARKKKDKFQLGFMVKERNESCSIAHIAYIVAGLKGLPVEVVSSAALENSLRMFWRD